MEKSILKTKDLTMVFGGLTAVSKLNLDIKENQIYGLIGPNGAGKTTAFNMITGVYMPTSGEVFLNEEDISKYKPNKITNLGIARTFQNIRLFTTMSVVENVMVARHLRMGANFPEAVLMLPSYKRKHQESYNEAMKLLKKVELEKEANELATSLPYGKQRRLEIARALATSPKVLLLDEPAAGMNPQESIELMNFIAKIRDQFSLTILMIEHHMQVVMGICEKITVLDYGQTIAVGNPLEIQNNQRVIEAYLGVD